MSLACSCADCPTLVVVFDGIPQLIENILSIDNERCSVVVVGGKEHNVRPSDIIDIKDCEKKLKKRKAAFI